MTLAYNDLFSLDSPEMPSQLPEINYSLKVAIKMFKKKKRSNYQRTVGTLHLPLITCSLLDDEKSVFLKWKTGRNTSEH